MDLKLVRTAMRPDGIFGALSDINGKQIAVTLEHSFDGEPALPAGTYICQRGKHLLDHSGPIETFEVMGVPGHTGILFHVGNYNHDSDGCILLGQLVVNEPGKEWVISNSRNTFNRFMQLQGGVNEFTLEVTNA